MEESVGVALREFFNAQIHKHTGNVVMMVGSSECGKSTMYANVLLPTFSWSNGFITTFMCTNFDSLPIQIMLIKNMAIDEAKRAKLLAEAQKMMTSGGKDGSLSFKLTEVNKVKEWIIARRGYDPDWIRKIYGLRLVLNKHYGDTERVRDFRFAIGLDDEIDIGGSLVRKVCLTYRNRNISFFQSVQDITNLDCAVRNSAPIVFFGYTNFPHRREQIVKGYLEPYLPGLRWQDKMVSLLNMTENKCFICMVHRTRSCYYLNTKTGAITQLPEIKNAALTLDMEPDLPDDDVRRKKGVFICALRTPAARSRALQTVAPVGTIDV